MKHTVGALVLSTFFGISARAEPIQPPPSTLSLIDPTAMVRLASLERSVCGSGFIDPRGYIATNLHIIRSVCPADDCAGLQLARGVSIGQKPQPFGPPQKPVIAATLPALDVGFLDVGLPPGTIAVGESIERGEALTTIGFPRCGELTVTHGNLTSADPLHLETTLTGGPGNSGSPILNARGELVGIVDEAIGVLDALFVKTISGKSVTLRGGRLDRTNSALMAPDPLPRQLELLTDFHLAFKERPLIGRLRGSFDFMVALRELIREAQLQPHPSEAAAVLKRGGAILADPPRAATGPAALHAERLAVEYGLYGQTSLTSGRALERYRHAVESAGRSLAHLPSRAPAPTLGDLNMALGALCVATLLALLRGLIGLRKKWTRSPSHRSA